MTRAAWELQELGSMTRTTDGSVSLEAGEGAVDRRWARWKWWGAAAGLLTGLGDAVLLNVWGVTFTMNDRDAIVPVGLYFGLSFAVLGFLLGVAAAARRRDRRAAAIIQAQTEAIAAARARLLQNEKLAALGQLAAAIAHEVRNPLAIMRSAAQGIAESLPEGGSEATRACSFITAEIDRLTSVVGSLLAFARPPRIAAQPIAVPDLLERARLLVESEAKARPVRLRCATPAFLPAVNADADLLCQVLLGLVDNAVEVSPAGSEVSIEAHAVESAVEIAVADRGPGVPADLRERIFDPFFTTRTQGTGLGLAIAKQIVEAHGGQIRVDDHSGGGARFTLSLPTAPATVLAA
jgi:signal transduction histidine kinase